MCSVSWSERLITAIRTAISTWSDRTFCTPGVGDPPEEGLPDSFRARSSARFTDSSAEASMFAGRGSEGGVGWSWVVDFRRLAAIAGFLKISLAAEASAAACW